MAYPNPYSGIPTSLAGIKRPRNHTFEPYKRPRIDGQVAGYDNSNNRFPEQLYVGLPSSNLRPKVVTRSEKVHHYPGGRLPSSVFPRSTLQSDVNTADQTKVKERPTNQTSELRNGPKPRYNSNSFPPPTRQHQNVRSIGGTPHNLLNTGFQSPNSRPPDMLSRLLLKPEVESNTQYRSVQFQPTLVAHPASRVQSTGINHWPHHDERSDFYQSRPVQHNYMSYQHEPPCWTWQFQTLPPSQYEEHEKPSARLTAPAKVEESSKTRIDFMRTAAEDLLRRTGLEHMIQDGSAQIPITLDGDDDDNNNSTVWRCSSTDTESHPRFDPSTPLASHSPSRTRSPSLPSGWQNATAPIRGQKRIVETWEDKAERAAKQAQIDAAIEAEKKLYEDNKDSIERYCSTKHEYGKAPWFVRLHAWKNATRKILTTKNTTSDVQNEQNVADSVLVPGQPDTIVQDALAAGKRPDTIRHPHDRVCVPEYPTDDDIETCVAITGGRYRCTHEFGNLKCCTDGLDRAAKLCSINKQLNTWRAKVERLIHKKELHASHKTWDRFYDGELRKKELEAQEKAKRAAQIGEAAQVPAQTEMQQADEIATVPLAVATVAPITNTPSPQTSSRMTLFGPEQAMSRESNFPAPETLEVPSTYDTSTSYMLDLSTDLTNSWPPSTDYDRFLDGEPVAVKRITKSFFEYFRRPTPATVQVSELPGADKGRRDLSTFLKVNEPVTSEVDKRRRFSELKAVRVADGVQLAVASSVSTGATSLEILPPTTVDQAGPADQQSLDSELVGKLKKHDRLHRDAQCREQRKKWPNFELLEAWWTASRRKEQSLPLMPEELTLLQRAEPSWDSDKRPGSEIKQLTELARLESAPDREQTDDHDSLFADESDQDSLFGDDNEL